MSHRFLVLVVALPALSLVVSCSGGEPPGEPETLAEACAEIEGCEDPVVGVAGPKTPIWRVLVVRDGSGAVRIETIDEVDVPEATGVPQGPQGGTHGLAALDASGTPLEVQRLRFPETLALEGHSTSGETYEEDLTDGETSAVGYLRAAAGVETIAVVDGPDSIVDSRSAPEPGEVGRATEPLVEAAPGSACSHVMILEGRVDEIWYPKGLWDRYPLRTLGYRQQAVVRSALGRLNAMHCVGVGRIAFVSFDKERTGGMVTSWEGGYAGDLVLINADLDVNDWGVSELDLVGAGRQAFLSYIVAHEAAHATNNLLDRDTDVRLDGDWAPTQRTLADETIDRVRLRAGLGNEWARLHESFARQGWITSYGSGSGGAGSSYDMAKAGFMSEYSSGNHREDLAEFAAWPVARHWYRDAEVPLQPLPVEPGGPPRLNDHACIAMRDHMEMGVPQDLSAVYAKLSFLRDVGIVTEDDFEDCVGDSIGLPHDTEGFAVYQEGTRLRTYTDATSAVIGTLDGRYVFEMKAEGGADFDGETYPAELTLRLDLGEASGPVEQVSWPRGLYALDMSTPHEFRLRLDGAAAGNFDVTDGFALVARASNDRIVGSVFVREAFRYMAPVPVPQTFDPPLQFRFLMDN